MTYFRLFNQSMQPYMEESDDFGGGEDGFEVETIETDTIEPDKQIDTAETTEPTEDTTEVETVVEQPKVKLKYNHEEKEYSLDEVVPLAQKGMNYDKVQNELQALKSSPILSYIEKVAKANNMTPEQVIEAMQRNDEQAEINALAERENVPFEIAERLYKTEQKTAQIENSLNAEKQTKAQQEKIQQEWLEFESEYPGIAIKDIPKEVLERRELTGKSLVDCMAWNERKLLREENAILKQNEKNSKRAPIGGVSKLGTETIVKDDFLEGFDED